MQKKKMTDSITESAKKEFDETAKAVGRVPSPGEPAPGGAPGLQFLASATLDRKLYLRLEKL